MISAGDFRNGVTFEMDGSIFQVIEFCMLNLVRCCFVRTKLKILLQGLQLKNF